MSRHFVSHPFVTESMEVLRRARSCPIIVQMGITASDWPELNENKIPFLNYFQRACSLPGDFITEVKQVNSQSDLISMSIFAGPFYLTIKSSVCIVLI